MFSLDVLEDIHEYRIFMHNSYSRINFSNPEGWEEMIKKIVSGFFEKSLLTKIIISQLGK